MSSLNETSESTLINFFIFNCQFGQKEGQEEEKLLFYHPSSASTDVKVKHIGLAEAITRFASTFNKENDCESLHTQKTHQIFYQAEPNFWMVMTVSVGWVKREREGSFVKEYHSEAVQDTVLRAKLMASYKDFTFHHLSFSSFPQQDDNHKLKNTLEKFFNEYLCHVDVLEGDVTTVWSGVSFLPLHKQTFLKVHSSITVLQAAFPKLNQSAVFYNNNVIWCEFSMDDLCILSRYLQSPRVTRKIDNAAAVLPTLSQHEHNSSFLNRFIYDSSGSPFNLVYLHIDNDAPQQCQLLIYVYNAIVVCMAFPVSEKLHPSQLEGICSVLERGCREVVETVGGEQREVGMNGGECPPQELSFLYHNSTNMAIKTHIKASLPPETLHTIVDMESDIQRLVCRELIVKTSDDFWVVGRRGNGRTSYVVVAANRNSNLVEVTDEVKRMCSSQFSNIFMPE